MEPAADLFAPAHKAQKQWRLVTNHQNLLYMLAAGLVMPPKGFGRKYYLDTLAAFPGWIPLFPNDVPKAAVAHSVSERSHLIPCVATVDLDALRGKVLTIDASGFAKEINFPEGLDGSERVLLVPAPLPVSWITSIVFQSTENRAACEADARDFGNVPLQDFKREVSAATFAKGNGGQWPPTAVEISTRDAGLDASFAAGGMMAMLWQMGNLGEVAMQACRLAFDPDVEIAQSINDPLVSPLGKWMQSGLANDSEEREAGSDISIRLFWGAVNKVLACRFSDIPTSPQDALLDYLGSVGDGMDDRIRLAMEKLVRELRTIASFTDSTVTEIFERHPKTFSRVMAMFFLREKCSDLLQFKHPLLTESDFTAAAILFAARDGWLGLPLQLRQNPASPATVLHRMAVIAHRRAGSGLDLGTPPARPLILRELFVPGPKGWRAAQKEAALILARECKWGGIQTRIRLGKGDYRLLIDGTGAHIIVAGEAKSVETEVDQSQFFAGLASTQLSEKQERKVRELLKA